MLSMFTSIVPLYDVTSPPGACGNIGNPPTIAVNERLLWAGSIVKESALALEATSKKSDSKQRCSACGD
ncbi:MAG: hypothetical protein ACC645_23535 [Pirellulales bacterium]